jgi:HPt (histidine-containing phosphotransfer) domain-containing protein
MTHLPIIALTANALRGDDERCRAAGMNDHLGKPIDPHALYVMLARYAPADKRLDDALDFDMPAADTPEMDMTNLLQIEKSLGRQYVVELIHKSLPEIDRYMATLLQGEGEAMQHAAHELKTLCALFGMTGLAGLAEGIEQACAARQEGEARRLATEAEARFAVQRLSLTDRFGEEDARTP